MKKFANKFRTESSRLKIWDYSTPWWYFVTICTKNHNNDFGEVKETNVELNNFGNIAINDWTDIPSHFPNVEIDEFVVMPNHIHGIVIIAERRDVSCRDVVCRDVASNVSTNKNEFYSKISPKAGSLSSIVRSYKSGVTRKIRRTGYNKFSWQSRFYDRIIRNEKELFRIRIYIKHNPLKWQLEKSISENLEIE